jgi:peptidyl-Lys metalloendopeptidase
MMKNRESTIIHGAMAVVIGLMFVQTSDALGGHARDSGDHPRTSAVQIAQNADWCCINGKLQQLDQSLCADKQGRYFDNAEAARDFCIQMTPAAPTAPSPMPPSVRIGVCCLDGELLSLPRSECRDRQGRYYDDREEAANACRREGPPEQPPVREGVCCLDGEPHPMPERECSEQGGRFFEHPEDAERLCRRMGTHEQPPVREGVCCLHGESHPMPEHECREQGGRFFESPEDAERLCRRERPHEQPSVREGVCCLHGEPHPMPEPECREQGGRFFERPEDAERLCRRVGTPEQPPAREGVCCLHGEPHPMLERECREQDGRFFERPEDAERYCRRAAPPPPEVICCLDGRPQPMPEPECHERGGSREGLLSRLDVVKSRYGLAEAKKVRFTLTNASGEPIRVLKWHTPLEGFTADILDIRKDGQPAPYIGRQIKRGAPTADDYVLIPPCESVSTVIDVADGYDVSAEGDYNVALASRLFDVARGKTARLAMSVSELRTEPLVSDVVSLAVRRAPGESEVRRPTPFDAEPQKPLEIGLLTKELSKNGVKKASAFVSCSSAQQTQINTALAFATLTAAISESILQNQTAASVPKCARYTKWFGSYSASRLATATSNFDKIVSALQNQQITFHCDCNSNDFAYVYPNNPYHVWLCNDFWNAAPTGTDSRSGTIVHEMSHFYVVAGTKDYVYGQTKCKSLAVSDPDKAVKNADSNEYFAENDPSEKCGAEHLLLTLPLLLALAAGMRLVRRKSRRVCRSLLA